MLETKYRIGQVVSHNKQKYSGVIVDVDPSFQPQGVHSIVLLKKNIAAEYPWYRILVNNTSHTTYVKEPLLEKDDKTYPIYHPDITLYLKEEDGLYRPYYNVN